MGDPTDPTAGKPKKELLETPDDETFCPVAAGCLNVGKLLTANVPTGEDCNTAIETVGMICDLTHICHNKPGPDPHSADIVGTCKKNKANEDPEHHLATCLTCVTEGLDARTSTSDVMRGTES